MYENRNHLALFNPLFSSHTTDPLGPLLEYLQGPKRAIVSQL